MTVWCSTSPVLERKQLGHVVRDVGRDALQIMRAHARSKQRLVRVTERRVHQQQAPVLANLLSKALGSLLHQHVTPAPRAWVCYKHTNSFCRASSNHYTYICAIKISDKKRRKLNTLTLCNLLQ